MKKIILLLFIAVNFCCISFAQAPDQQWVDTLLSKIDRENSDENKIKYYADLMSAYTTYMPEEGLKYEKVALELAEKTQWKPGIAEINRKAGRLYYRAGNFKLALDRHHKALDIYEELKDTLKIINVLTEIGQDHGDGGNFEEARDYFINALKLAELGNNFNEQGNLNSLLAWVYSMLGNIPESTRYNLNSLKLFEQVGNTNGIGVAYSNLSSINAEIGNYPEALRYLQEGMKVMKKTKDQLNLINIYVNIGYIYQKMDKMSDAINYYNLSRDLAIQNKDKFQTAFADESIGNWYLSKGDHTNALQYYLASIKGYQSVSSKHQLVNALCMAANCYLKLKKYEEAKKYFNEAEILTRELKSPAITSIYYSEREKLDSLFGNWENAYFHYKTHIQIRDSINSEQNLKKSLQMNVQYEFDKKEAAAKAEQDKKDALASADLKRQKILRNSFVGGFSIMLLFAGVFFAQRNRIKKGKKRSDELLLNILPSEVAEELKNKGSSDAKHFEMVSVLFTDFKNFTSLSENMSAQELVNEINYCYSEFDRIISECGIEKIKTIGDAYMCAGGLPVPNNTNACDTVKAAIKIRDFMEKEKEDRNVQGKSFFEIRIGIHTGPVVAGIVGIKKFAYDIWGDTVNIAARLESSGEEGKINISGATYDLIKDKFRCTYRGKIMAKNKGEIDMYFVEHN